MTNIEITKRPNGAILNFNRTHIVYLTNDQIDCLAMVGRGELDSAQGVTSYGMIVAFQGRALAVVISLGVNGRRGRVEITRQQARDLPAAAANAKDLSAQGDDA